MSESKNQNRVRDSLVLKKDKYKVLNYLPLILLPLTFVILFYSFPAHAKDMLKGSIKNITENPLNRAPKRAGINREHYRAVSKKLRAEKILKNIDKMSQNQINEYILSVLKGEKLKGARRHLTEKQITAKVEGTLSLPIQEYITKLWYVLVPPKIVTVENPLNKKLLIRGGVLGFGLGHVAGGLANKALKWVMLENEKSDEEPILWAKKKKKKRGLGAVIAPIQMLTDHTTKLIVVALLLVWGKKRIPSTIKAPLEMMFPKAKQSNVEWVRQKIQNSFDFLFEYPIYILVILAIFTFRKQILNVIKRPFEENTLVKHSFEFIKMQHDSIIKAGKEMLDTTNKWYVKTQNQVLNYNQRDLDLLAKQDAKIDSLMNETSVLNKVVGEMNVELVKRDNLVENCNNHIMDQERRVSTFLGIVSKENADAAYLPLYKEIENTVPLKQFMIADSYNSSDRQQKLLGEAKKKR